MGSLRNKFLLGGALCGLVLVIVGAVVGFKVLTDYVDDEIADSTKLANGTEQYDRWVELPFPKTFSVHYFHIKNPEEVMDTGAKPIMEQIGPFVYDEHVHKEDIEFNAATGILTYDDFSEYKFNTDLTSAENQAIKSMTILNVPMMGLIQTFENLESLSGLLFYMINQGYKQIFPGSGLNRLFLKVHPEDYSFGGYRFCIPNQSIGANAKIICALMRIINKESLPTLPDRSIMFSFFGRKNGTSDGRWETDSGTVDINKLGELQSWKGETKTTLWDGDYCNQIKGGDSIIYKPYNDKDTEFDVFSSDICRHVRLHYDGDIERKGIPGYKNILRKDTIDISGEKECYCIKEVRDLTGKRECLPLGFMDMSRCQDAPIILSFPHFLWADQATANTVEGLNAVEEDHVTFIEMQPDTGSPLRGSKRVQFNMVVRKIPGIDMTDNIIDAGIMMPLVWVDEGSEISDDLANKLQEDYLDQLVLVDGVRWGLIAVGIALFLGCSGSYFFFRKK